MNEQLLTLRSREGGGWIPDEEGICSITDPGICYYGIVPSSEFISGTELVSVLGINFGTWIDQEPDWLKIGLDGNLLMIAKNPIKSYVTKPMIIAADVEVGNRTVTVNGLEYHVEVINGANTNPYLPMSRVGVDFRDNPGTHGSDYNRIFYRLATSRYEYSAEGIPYGELAQFTPTELSLNYLSHIKENPDVTSGTVGLGSFSNHNDVAIGHTTWHSQPPHWAWGWRPVLRLKE